MTKGTRKRRENKETRRTRKVCGKRKQEKGYIFKQIYSKTDRVETLHQGFRAGAGSRRCELYFSVIRVFSSFRARNRKNPFHFPWNLNFFSLHLKIPYKNIKAFSILWHQII
jgi:hypothetical protein